MIPRTLPILGAALVLALCACGRAVNVSLETAAIMDLKSIQMAQRNIIPNSIASRPACST
jgi:hypothetical protein